MKNTKIFLVAWLIVIALLLTITSIAQTDNYSCNVICLNQPDHVMQGVNVDLYDANDQLIGTTTTDEAGYFYFENLNIGESYVAKFNYDAENNYVDIADAFQILFYTFGYIDFDEIQLLAADVNGDNEVNIQDFFIVLIDFYINQNDFPVGNWILPDWEFTIDGDKATGGPSGTIVTGNIGDGQDKSTYFVETDYSDIINIENLNVIEVPLYYNQNEKIAGLGIIAEYNSDLFEIVDIKSPIQDLNYNVKKNEIRIGWTNTEAYKTTQEAPLATIYLRQKYYTHGEQIENIEIKNESHILDAKGNKMPFITFRSHAFKTAGIEEYETVNIYPNPCSNYFNIQLSNDISTAEYKLYNGLGQLIDAQTITNNGGQAQISTENLKKGIYFYQVNYQSKSITGPLSIR